MAYQNNFYNPNMVQPNPYNYTMYQPQIQQPQMPPMQQMQQPVQSYRQPSTLQGKAVDSIDVVKATDIPLDFSVSYFPLTDGTAIVTKQLMQDGTSKTIVYKPVETEAETKETVKYATLDDVKESIKKIDNTSLKDEIKQIKRQIKDITDDIKDITDEIKGKD